MRENLDNMPAIRKAPQRGPRTAEPAVRPEESTRLTPQAEYYALMHREDLAGMRTQEAMDHMGRLRELATRLKEPEGLRRVMALADELMSRELQPIETSRLHYFLSDTWERLRINRLDEGGQGGVWQWEQPEIEQELIHLRRALRPDALKKMSTQHVCQILANMAALLNHVGRVSEALEYWDRAVAFLPGFGIARGKRGYALTHYARVLYDRTHSERFLKKARTDLSSAATSELPDDARRYFQSRLEWLDKAHPGTKGGKDLALFNYSEGSCNSEVTYRKWCLEQRLFLSPLNDLGPYPAAMKDDLVVPALVRGNDGGAFYQGIFNQMKQSYVSARYLYYEGITSRDPHFSDKDVLLFDTVDYPSYSLAIERIKAAFQMSYAVFDRLAYFLNFYLDLSIPEHRLTFRTFWYEMQRREEGLLEVFAERTNWPLRGLFWLSKDLYEEQEGFRETLDPDAETLAEMRGALERRYLKVHEDCHRPSPDAHNRLVDSVALSVNRSDFEARALRLLKKSRSALMCLCYAVHHEERTRDKQWHVDPTLPAVTLSILDDSWKV